MTRTPGAETVLVTGALGCLGVWVSRELLASGGSVVGFDRSRETHRLDALIDEEQRDRLVLVEGDVTDADALGQALDSFGVTSVVHLAALQIPACRADPVAGAHVNVVGTLAVFEAVRARLDRIGGVVYASSVAVYGPDDEGRKDERPRPASHYGVHKVANEAAARVMYADHGVRSVGLRPYVVFGPGRDQGLTSALTEAIRAAARHESFEIPFGGPLQVDYVRDAARAFVAAARELPDGAVVENLPGTATTVAEFVSVIEDVLPGSAGLIGWRDDRLPFPPALESDLAAGRTSLPAAIGETARLGLERSDQCE